MEQGELFEERYLIAGQLGTGGQSNVYRADDVKTGRRVAIKLLHTDGDGVRFIREGRVVSRLESPHTVRLIEFDRAPTGQFYLVFEFVAGETLREVAVRESPIPWSRVARYARGMLIALAEAHEHGIVHRDIKPSNVMLGAGDEVKVLDFGVARLNEADDEEGAGLTAPGEVLGTPRYVAPETLAGEPVTPAADVFAVGLVAWELLAGRPANDARTGADIVLRHLDSTPYRLPTDLEVPDEARRWVMSLCNKDPNRRPSDAAAALAALDEFEEAPKPLVTTDLDSGSYSTDDLETMVLGADDDLDPPHLQSEDQESDTPTPSLDHTDPDPWVPPVDHTDPDPWVPPIADGGDVEEHDEVAATTKNEVPDQAFMEELATEESSTRAAEPPPPQPASSGLPDAKRPAPARKPRPTRAPAEKKTGVPTWLIVLAVLTMLALIAALMR